MLQETDLRAVPIPEQFALGLASDLADVTGRVTTTAISLDTPLWLSGISQSDLGSVAPPGSVVVGVRFNAVTASILQPGDRIDLVAATGAAPSVIARGALVLPPRLQTEGAGEGGLFSANTAAPLITLVAVTPDEAPNLSAAAHLDQVTAILVP